MTPSHRHKPDGKGGSSAAKDERSTELDESTAIIGTNPESHARRTRPARGPSKSSKKRTFTLAQLLIAVGATLALAGVAIGALVAHYENKLDDRPAASSNVAEATGGQPDIDLERNQPNDPLSMGEADAPVVLVEYSDYRCPFCSVWSREVKPQLMKYVDDGTLRIEHHDLPIFGEQSVLAAIAGRAAGNQGKFWEYYDAIHNVAPTQGHPDLPKEVLLQFAQQIGIPDMSQFEADLSDPAIQQDVLDDAKKATDLGASSTPLFVINGEPVMGAQPLDIFVQKIEQHAAGE